MIFAPKKHAHSLKKLRQALANAKETLKDLQALDCIITWGSTGDQTSPWGVK